MLASRRNGAPTRATRWTKHAKLPAFMSLQGGTAELVDALVPRLKGDLRLGCAVQTLDEERAEN